MLLLLVASANVDRIKIINGDNNMKSVFECIVKLKWSKTKKKVLKKYRTYFMLLNVNDFTFVVKFFFILKLDQIKIGYFFWFW